MKNLIAAAALAACALTAHATGSVLVANGGPLTGGNFNTYAYNGSSGNIQRITFDLSTATTLAGTPLTFGGLNSADVTGLNGGTATLFGLPGDTVFGFIFTGFGPTEHFSFSWDPDTINNANYGAQIREFVGAGIKADLVFGVSTTSYTGTMGLSGVDVAANLGPVPEPTTHALMLAGLLGLGWMARRRTAQAGR